LGASAKSEMDSDRVIGPEMGKDGSSALPVTEYL